MSSVTKNLRDGVLTIQDDGAANSIEVLLDEGNLRITQNENVINVLDRGSLSHMRPGDEQPVEVSFDIKFVEYIKQVAGANETPYEALTKTGGASAWVTTNTTGDASLYTTDLSFEIATPVTGDFDETITLSMFKVTQIEFAEGDEYDTLAVTGQAFIVRPTIVKDS